MYLEVMKKEFMQQWTYRANTVLYLLGIVLQLFVQVSLWTYLSKENAAGDITYNDMLLYVVFSMVTAAFTNSDTCDNLGGKVYDGSITIDIIRPISVKGYMLGQFWGQILYRISFCILPVLLTSILLLGIRFQFSILRILLFIVSMVLAAFLMFYLNYILGLTAFWLQKIWFMSFYVNGCMNLFGGSSIPIWFYPDWLKDLSLFLPFRYMVFEPINICIQYNDWRDWIRIILIQMAWLVLLFCLERLLWKKAERRIFVNGG